MTKNYGTVNQSSNRIKRYRSDGSLNYYDDDNNNKSIINDTNNLDDNETNVKKHSKFIIEPVAFIQCLANSIMGISMSQFIYFIQGSRHLHFK